jgi:hypothetical protein
VLSAVWYGSESRFIRPQTKICKIKTSGRVELVANRKGAMSPAPTRIIRDSAYISFHTQGATERRQLNQPANSLLERSMCEITSASRFWLRQRPACWNVR